MLLRDLGSIGLKVKVFWYSVERFGMVLDGFWIWSSRFRVWGLLVYIHFVG